MDHSLYDDLDFSPPNNLPQESKLATYMNRSATTPNRNQGPLSQTSHGQTPIGQPPHGQPIIGQGHMSQSHLSQGQLGQGHLGQGLLSQAQIVQAQLSQTQLGQGHLGQGLLAQSQLGPGHLSQSQLGQAHLGQGLLGLGHLGQGQLGQTHLAQGQLSQTLGQGQLGQAHLSQGQLGHALLAQGQLGQPHLGQGQLGQGQLGQGQLGQGHIGQGQLGQGHIGQGQLGQGHIGQGQLGQGHIGQGQLGQGHIGQGQLGQAHLGQGQLGQPHLGQGQLGHASLGQAHLGHIHLPQGHLGQGQLSPTQLSPAQLSQAMGNLSLDAPPPTAINKPVMLPPAALLSHPPPAQIMKEIPPPPLYQQVIIGEYMPINFYAPSNLISESAESLSQINLPPIVPPPQVHQENVGGTTYFFTNEIGGGHGSGSGMGSEPCLGVASTSGYGQQMYPPPHLPSHLPSAQSRPGLSRTPYYSRSGKMNKDVYRRNDEMYYIQPSLFTEFPTEIGDYVELAPLDSEHQPRTAFSAKLRNTASTFALRRIPLTNGAELPASLEVWTQINHPNIVRFFKAFVTDAFGDESAILVYEHHLACLTLLKKYILSGSSGYAAEASARYTFSADPDAPRPYTHQQNTQRTENADFHIPELELWPILIQISGALREIHNAGLACRNLDVTKVVVTGNRSRISWGGMGELLDDTHIVQAQQEDLTALGLLALSLACRTTEVDDIDACLDYVKRVYSKDFTRVAMLSQSVDYSKVELPMYVITSGLSLFCTTAFAEYKSRLRFFGIYPKALVYKGINCIDV
ncbi:PAN2-PAN3 deadenylation complex subunit PAN3 isoform X3 [Pararge aegeria]|uniref:PAN2-PAN3 deadenylation complex subunit PAN3 isoform X3 n=1 Tax=Pararge aegeria TaxID=116150 RepID=UPI0019CFF594|nr:PAN2-PAN3 deadenylation complex subunit PAN3 isoform X3 [Pararge aegeria]